MNKKILNILKFVFFLGLGIFLVWYSIHQIPDEEFNKFTTSLKTAKYWMVFPVFLILSASHIIRALRWKLLMEPMGYKPSLVNTFFAVMIGYLANFAFPRLGEVLKCTILAKYEGVPADKNVGTIVAERAFDVVCLLLVFVMALVLQYDVVIAAYHNMQSKMKDLSQHQTQTGNNLFFYIKIGFIVFLVALLVWVIATKRWQSFIQKIKGIAKGILEGLTSAWQLKQKKLFIFYSILIWVLYITGTWIGLYATEGSGLGFQAAVSCLAFASIGMIVTPGGIGSYAVLIALVLELYNVPYSIGLANGTLQWFAQFIIVLFVGFICLILIPVYNRNKAIN